MKQEAELHWLRNVLCGSIGAVLFVALGVSAQGQAARAPLGFWATKPANELLFVSASGCRFTGKNAAGATITLIEGNCLWDASSVGGILTIMNVHNFRPAPIRYSVVWVNSRTIKVFGDVFYKQD